jgi:hypothetical protein
MDTKNQPSIITIDIFDGEGNSLATVSFYNMGVNAAHHKAAKLANSLSDDWKMSAMPEFAKEVRS